MVKTMLWVLAGIVVVDVVVAGLIVGYAVLDRYRSDRQLRRLEAIWHMDLQHRARRPLAMIHRMRGVKTVGVLAATGLLFAGTAAANHPALEAVGSVLGSVADRLGIGSGEEIAEISAAQADAEIDGTVDPESQSDPRSPRNVRDDGMKWPPPTQRHEAAPGGEEPASLPADPVRGPSSLTATPVSSSSIVLSWTDVEHEASYTIERSTGGDWTRVADASADDVNYNDADLAPGTTYFYRVAAVDGEGSPSPPSDTASATTVVDPPAATALDAIQGSEGTIVLTWSDVMGETAYRVERSLAGQAGWTTIATTGQDVTAFTDAGLPVDTAFQYRVVATNAGGDSAPSNEATVTTAGAASPQDQPPPSPSSPPSS